ncbi:unnamed protein product [Dicrocoelium dendriticum]|nr:unnamed protein product [Dicrocoelium dendriticum]
MSDTGDILSVSSEEEPESCLGGVKFQGALLSDTFDKEPRCEHIEDDDEEEEETASSVVSVYDGDENSDEIDVSESGDCEIVSVEGAHGEEKWRDIHGPFKTLNALIQAGYTDPRMLLIRMFGLSPKAIPQDVSERWGLLLSLLMEPTPRPRLSHVNTLEKVIELLSTCRCILVVTGAGVSVSCGIPDFRSRDGIYARLAQDYPDLSSPQAMFDMSYFSQNPSPFFKFAKEIFPGQFTPSLTHRFVALLESKRKLLRNYTQNIDTLEQVAGITRLIQCHGSFATATCTTCRHRVPGEYIKESVFSQKIPYCPQCRPSESTIKLNGMVTNDKHITRRNGEKMSNLSFGVLKPDIVFFGEDLSSEFHDTLASDVDKADLVLVIGSSLKVRPVAHIPNSIPESVPQVLINREPLSNHDFDVELLGDCDVIVTELCARLGWELSPESASKRLTLIPLHDIMGERSRGDADQKALASSQNEPSLHTANGPVDVSEEAKKDASSTEPEAFIETSAEATTLNTAQRPKTDVIEVDDSDEESHSDDLWDVAAFLPPHSFTHVPPNQYVFPGAELFISQSESADCPCSSHSDSNIMSPVHHEETMTHAQLVANTLPMRVSTGFNAENRLLRRLILHESAAGGSLHRMRCSNTEEDPQHIDQLAGDHEPQDSCASGPSSQCRVVAESPTRQPPESSVVDAPNEHPAPSSPTSPPHPSPETASAPDLKRVRTASPERQQDSGDR